MKHFILKIKPSNTQAIIKTHKSASEQLIKTTKSISEKDSTFKFGPKIETSHVFRPVLNHQKSEMVLNEKKTGSTVLPSDPQLIPIPKTPKNPQEDLRRSLIKLKSIHWNETVRALRDIIQISRFHPQILTNSMSDIYKGIITMLKSSRLTVARTACQGANELFMNMPNDQGPGFDNLVHALLQKTIDPNKYLQQDALEALDSMVIHVSPKLTVKALLHRRISNYCLNIRITASKLLTCVLGDSDENSTASLREETKTKLVFAAVKYLQDPNYDIKFHGVHLFNTLIEHPDFRNIFQKKITDDHLRKILHIIETARSPIRYSNI